MPIFEFVPFFSSDLEEYQKWKTIFEIRLLWGEVVAFGLPWPFEILLVMFLLAFVNCFN